MRCGAEFSSYKALAMHKRRAHNLGLFLSRAVSINSCPSCLSTFASRFSAINHLIRALHHWPLSQEPQRTQSHLAREKHGTAVQDLPRVEHGHQAEPATRSHPPTEPTTSHQDFLVPKTRGYLRISCRPTEPRHRTRDLDGSSPSPPSLAPSLQSDPPSSTAPNMGSIVAGHVPTAKIFPDRHFDETGRTSMSPRGSERIGRPTRRAGPPHTCTKWMRMLHATKAW